jgi:uncharacterized protein with HEPN domain
MRDPRERLHHILQAVANIQRHAAAGRRAFAENELIQVWVVHHLQIIGEAAAQLGVTFQNAHREIPWPQIVAMRNVLVHEYFGIDLEEVWKTVEGDLPRLRRQPAASAAAWAAESISLRAPGWSSVHSMAADQGWRCRRSG